MANSYGKIVVLGKSKQKSAPADLMDVLSQINPEVVPPNLLEGVFVTLDDNSRYQIDKKHLGNGINYDRIADQVKAAGGKQPINTIEIVVDIDYASRLLNNQVNRILGPHFG